MKKIAIIGGGAAGFFTAANLGEKLGRRTILFEQSPAPLQKVRISGGGRCNVTHACFNPVDLVEFYPRGKKELLSVFTKFQPGDTMEWFENRSVALKIEEDNRVFPITDSSLSVIECLLKETEKNGVEIRYSEGVQSIEKDGDNFIVHTKNSIYNFEKIIFVPGSSPKAMSMLKNLGHHIVPPVPSLFTFNIKDRRINSLMGLSFEFAEIRIPDLKLEADGPLLITHWGLSGPAVLKLSAWGAIELNRLAYDFEIKINFINKSKEECLEELDEFRNENAKKSVYSIHPFQFAKRFWRSLLNYLKIPENLNYSNLNKKQLGQLADELTDATYKVTGKSTFKEEFVTAGGLDLKEVNFKNMESRRHKNLFVAGEILNIDAITGGFNFQACWSESYLITEYLKQID